MDLELQRASLWKRIGAGLLDLILLCVVATGLAAGLSWAIGYDAHYDALEQGYARYEAEHGIEFDISQEAFSEMTQQEQERYQAAYDALIADEAVMREYNIVLNMTLIIITFGILLGHAVLEWAVPMILKNGQTIGKKCFGIGLMRVDNVKMSNMQFFIRTILGKFTIETMVPVYMVIMLLFGLIGFTGTLVIGLIGLIQIVCMVATKTNSLIHDLISGTVAVDLASQRIFDTTEDLIAYQKKLAAERAARQPY